MYEVFSMLMLSNRKKLLSEGKGLRRSVNLVVHGMNYSTFSADRAASQALN